MTNEENIEDKSLGNFVKSAFGEKIGGDMIKQIKNGIDNELSQNQILNDLFRVIEPNLTDDKIKRFRDLIRFRAVVTQGQPPPPVQ